MINDTTITTPNIEINNLLNISTYYWRVAAIDTINNFKWSEERSFYYAFLPGINNNNQNGLYPNSQFLYPNPCKWNYFYINNRVGNVVEIRIYNSQGRFVKSLLRDNLDSSTSVEMINVSELANGIYYVIYKFNKDSNIYYTSSKLIIEK